MPKDHIKQIGVNFVKLRTANEAGAIQRSIKALTNKQIK